MRTLCVDSYSHPYVFSAVKEIAELSGGNLAACEVANAIASQSNKIGVIPLITYTDVQAFGANVATLWRAGCRRFIGLSPEGVSERPWLTFSAHQRAAFEKAIPTCCAEPGVELGIYVQMAFDAPGWAVQRVREFSEAALIYHELLYTFGHNTRCDLSNQFLAPARLLLKAGQRPDEDRYLHWLGVWGDEEKKSGFAGRVYRALKREPEIYGAIGEELAQSCARVQERLTKRTLTVEDTETLMSLLTAVRVRAGIRTRSNGSDVAEGSQLPTIDSTTQSSGYRILIVDDHASAWTCVFNLLQTELNAEPGRLSVSFDYSFDGKQIAGSENHGADISYSYYDVVVLDVFLGANNTGLDLLKKIRRDCSEVPVLLWTTSRDEEIAAEASLANGILLKKTIGWSELKDAVSRWVVRGNAVRTTTLPNPFFNYAISKLEYRRAAMTAHEWCLKQLDSFHALDDNFFRFFTDHGGRHIVKFWELLQQALQPFLQDPTNLLLAGDPEERQTEVLCLYLAVICHELGMFPLEIGEVETYPPKPPESTGQSTSDKMTYQECVRGLHAPRGMILLEQSCADLPPQVSWNDSSGNRVGELLKNIRFSDGRMAGQQVAVIVGYHARCFRDLTDGTFLTWDNMANAVRQRLDDACDNFLQQYDWINGFKASVKRLAPLFPIGNSTRDRLRRQCALFRFVDAIDISASRNPVEFLIEKNSEAISSREYLKRELCRRIEIDRGNVEAVFHTPTPSVSDVQCAFRELRSYLPEKQKEQEKLRRAIAEAEDFLKLDLASTMIEAPWSRTVAANGKPSPNVLRLQKALDIWLEQVWRVLKADLQLSEPFRDALVADRLIQRAKDSFLLTEHGCAVVAALTALSVAGEVLDEYAAIVDAGIESRISLGKFTYKPDEWAKVQEHRRFRTLSRVTVPLQA